MTQPSPPPKPTDPDDSPADEPEPLDAAQVHGPLHVEKLEGRQESGRDAQDEAEEDESLG